MHELYTHNWREARRLQAWRLTQQGWPQRQIAEALGVSEGAVSQWMTRAGDGGAEALRHRPPGAASRLTDEQLARYRPRCGKARSLWLRGRAVDTETPRRGDAPDVWRLLPSPPYRPTVQVAPLASPQAGASSRQRDET